MAYTEPALLWAAIVVPLLIVILLRRCTASSRVLPPGPKPLPIIGNMLQLPTTDPWLTYKDWADKYGDVVSITVLGRPIIVLNSLTAASEILEKRSASSAGRPQSVFACEICHYSLSPIVTSDMGLHRKYRRQFAQALNSRASQNYWTIEIQETRRMMARLFDTPDNLEEHIKSMVAGIAFLIIYGYEIKGKDDSLVHLAHKNVQNFGKAATPGAYLVDALPILRYLPAWFPGAGFQKEGAEFRDDFVALLHRPFELVTANMSSGTALPCFTTDLLERDGKMIEDDAERKVIMYSAGVLYGAAADTTVAAIYSFFLAMMLHPEIQSKAKAELDTVVGRDRLPTLEDQSRLIYCSAICKELLRWNPIVPLGVPRSMLEEETYRRFTLPKGAIVVTNIWAILRDPEVYPSPDRFMPERFLSEDEKSLQNPVGAHDFSKVSFGLGRRVCPGLNVAEGSIFAAVTTALWAFDISKPIGPDGKSVEPKLEFMQGLIHHPKTFSCEIKPRSTSAAEMLRTVA